MSDFFAPSSYWKATSHEPFAMFGAGHIAVIAGLLVSLVLLIVFGRRINHRCIRKYLVVSSIVWIALEIFKVVLFFATGDYMQGLREVLPLYMCSLFLFMLPLAAFTKGFMKKLGETTLCTLCLLSGLMVTFNCPALLNYPLWSFYSLHSLIYHAFMAATGVLLLSGGYVKLELKKFWIPLLSIAALAVPAIIMNNVVDTDYMLLRYAWGTPVLDDIAKAVGQIPLIFLMLICYTLMAFLMTGLGVLVRRAFERGQGVDGKIIQAGGEE